MRKMLVPLLLILVLSPIAVYADATYQLGASEAKIFADSHFTVDGSVNFWNGITADGVAFYATDGIFVGSGVTECGVPFSVYKQQEAVGPRVPWMDVTRTANFQGHVRPPASIWWTEIISGISWNGTLNLRSHSFFVMPDRTVAIYAGILWPPH